MRIRQKLRFRPGRGSLFLIGTFLISSAIVRVGSEAGQAFAREDNSGVSAEKHLSDPLTCEAAPDVKALLNALQKREHNLKLREQQIDGRMQALSVADQEITRKLAGLVRAEEELRSMIALSDKAAEDDLSKLTSVYESMKPKDAAALFEEMAPEFAAGFLGRMNPGAAAGIMAGLSPQAAYTVSVILAGRNAEVPRE